MSPSFPLAYWRALLWMDGGFPPLYHSANPEVFNGVIFEQRRSITEGRAKAMENDVVS